MTTQTAIKKWEMVQLGSLCEKTSSVNPTANPEKPFIYIDVSSVSNETLKIENSVVLLGKDAPSRARKQVKKGDVIFATVRPTLKRIAKITEEFDNQICSTGYCVVRPNHEKVDSDFIYFLLSTKEVMNYVENLQRGVSYPAISDKNLFNIGIALPALSEQKAIARTLTTVQDAITEQGKLVTKLKELKRSMMQHLFTHGTKGEKTKMTEIGEIPESWKVVGFESLCVLQRGKDLTKSDFKTGTIPVAGSNGIIGYHDIANVKAPAITVGRSGSVGLVKYYDQDIWAHNTALYVKDFKGNNEIFTAYYLEYMKLSSFKGGASVPTLDRNQFRTMLIALPPLDEQTMIASAMISLDDRIKSIDNKLFAYQNLFKTMLHELMSGERRIKNI